MNKPECTYCQSDNVEFFSSINHINQMWCCNSCSKMFNVIYDAQSRIYRPIAGSSIPSDVDKAGRGDPTV